MSVSERPALPSLDQATSVVRRPAGALAAHVDSIWFASRPALPHRRERSLPTGRVDIVIPLLQDSIVRFASVDAIAAKRFRGAVVSGAHDRFAVRGTEGASRVLGVHFKAGGAAAFFRAPLPDLRNRTVLLDELWSRDWAALAADCGYFDQSHLIHEFRRLAGLTPSAYAPIQADMPTHVPVVGGSQGCCGRNLQSVLHAAR